jgi:periplasmic protein TonB
MRLVASTLLAACLSVAIAPAQQQVYDPGNGVSLPVVITEVRAEYTERAKARGIEGTVLLKSVVLSNGLVGDVTVERALDAELDEQAVAAMKKWVFKPGLRDGQAVAVRIFCEMTFTLQ